MQVRPELSIIVPTLNEAANLPALAGRIAAALDGRSYELLVVDDQSTDDTPGVCAALARTHPLTLITREPKDGLSGAVLHGLRHATGDLLVVMDADLQHPPESIPNLLAPIEHGDADFALGSRYVAGGTTHGTWSLFRHLNSRTATLLARPIAARIQDPMSGFFALRRDALARAHHLTPLGYKIALELLCKCRVAPERVREIPIEFGARLAGESKLTLTQQFKYLEHLSRLYDFCLPRLAPVAKFLIATATAWLVALGVYALCLAKPAHRGPVAPPPAVAISYGAAVIATAVFHLRYTRTQREYLPRPHPWRAFVAISLCEWITACAAAMFCSLRVRDVTPGELFFYSFTAATLVRYVLRKEFLQDLRGLRKTLPLAGSSPLRLTHPAEHAPAEPRRIAG